MTLAAYKSREFSVGEVQIFCPSILRRVLNICSKYWHWTLNIEWVWVYEYKNGFLICFHFYYTNSKMFMRTLFKCDFHRKNWINGVSVWWKYSRKEYQSRGAVSRKRTKRNRKLALTRVRTSHASITRAKQQNIKKLRNVSEKSPPVGTSKRDRGKYFANVTEKRKKSVRKKRKKRKKLEEKIGKKSFAELERNNSFPESTVLSTQRQTREKCRFLSPEEGSSSKRVKWGSNEELIFDDRRGTKRREAACRYGRW